MQVVAHPQRDGHGDRRGRRRRLSGRWRRVRRRARRRRTAIGRRSRGGCRGGGELRELLGGEIHNRRVHPAVEGLGLSGKRPHLIPVAAQRAPLVGNHTGDLDLGARRDHGAVGARRAQRARCAERRCTRCGRARGHAAAAAVGVGGRISLGQAGRDGQTSRPSAATPSRARCSTRCVMACLLPTVATHLTPAHPTDPSVAAVSTAAG